MRPEPEAILEALDRSGEAFVVSDGARILSANNVLSAITGYSLAELLGLPSLTTLVSPEEREAEAERWRRRMLGERVPDHYDLTIMHKDGTAIPVEVAIRAYGDGSDPRVVGVIRPKGDLPATR